jgi:hypothetical protein
MVYLVLNSCEVVLSSRAKALVATLLLVVFLLPPAEARPAELLAATSFAVTASVEPTEILVGETALLSGTVSPVRTGTKVRIQQKQPSGWVNIAKSAMSPDGAYGYPLSPSGVGTYVYRARMPNVGTIAAANSPRRTLSVVEHHVIVFNIPAGTGTTGQFNTSDSPVVAEVGDILRIVNGDSTPHLLHTDGEPFPHPNVGLPPQEIEEYLLQTEFVGALYCHIHGANQKFWITVTRPAP